MVSGGKNMEELRPVLAVLKEMKEELTCAVCKKLLQEPTLMTCDHVFCKECIPKYMVSLCPVCKARFLSKNLRPAPRIEYMVKKCQELEALLKVVSSKGFTPGVTFFGEPNLMPSPKRIKSDGGSQMNISCQKHSTPIAKATAPPGGVSQSSEKRDNALGRQDSCPGPSTSGNKRAERKKMAESSLKRLKVTSSQVPIGIYEDECIFCHSFRRKFEGLGELLCIQDGKVVLEPDISSKATVLYAHDFCLHWAPGIYYRGDQIMNLESEIRRASKLACAKCGIKGAALGCFYEPCSRSYHPPCAYKVPGCRWDKENYNILCPQHVSKRLLCDGGPSQFNTEANASNHRPPSSFMHCRPQSTQLKQKMHHQQSKQNNTTQTGANELSKGKILVLLGFQLSQADMEILAEFSRRFNAVITDKWRNDVTHVVTSSDVAQKRIQLRHAYEVMMAIVCGTWIITIGWIKASLEKEGVPQEDYEVNEDCYGSLEGPRRGRITATANKAPNLFARFGFVLSKGIPLIIKGRLKELLIAGGGKVLSEGSEMDPGLNRRLLATYLVYNGESAEESGASGRIEELLELAKRKHCTRLISHKRVEEAIANFDTDVLNKEWYEE